jgi:iron complex outermembrane receptor protein
MQHAVKHACVLLCFLSWLSPFTQGQETTEPKPDTTVTYQIDEVVVTGTRTYRRIIDVPYAIERIDNAQFRFDRKFAVNDILGVVPGLFLESRYGNHDVRISIRGFGSRSNSGIRGVRILLDGIPESEPDGQTRIEAIDFQSVGSIEIVKGNSSSLYTNAPGGVINFINDISFPQTHFISFNQFGSFDLRQNGFKLGIRTNDYTYLTTYSYHHGHGYRDHSQDFWHILNSVLEVSPDHHSSLQVYGNFVDGLIRLPGSLTREQIEEDPLQANPRDIARDTKRITTKGRLGLRFNTSFGADANHELELTGYGTIKSLERTSSLYRIISRDGIGASARYVQRYRLFERTHEFSVGTDLYTQSGPVEAYQNIAGKKGDVLASLTDETIGNIGFYFQQTFNLFPSRMDLLFTGRYDKVVFDHKNQQFEVQNAVRTFEDFTPKFALNYKLTPTIAAYTSYGLSFDSPAANELDNFPTSSKPTALLNPDLQPQKSKSFELGIKGNVVVFEASFFRRVFFEGTYFNTIIDDEIVPFEVFGDVFFRNSARTNRQGFEFGVDAEVLSGLTAKVAYTFSDFDYDKYLAGSVEVDSLGNFVTVERDFSANIVPSNPEHRLSTSLAYERSLAEKLRGFAKVSYNSTAGMYVDDANTDKTESYQLINLTVGLDLLLGRINILISGGVNNLFDESYVAFVNTNSATLEFYEAGEPRNYFGGINVGYMF